MLHLLFIFLDGIGLGKDDQDTNPFSRARMPIIESILDGCRIVNSAAPMHTQRASLLSLDACLGVPGLPQSATGQAVLITGRNIPAELGYHYGPWPNKAVKESLQNGNLFNQIKKAGRRVSFLNAYPPRYFEAIQSGKRLYSSIPFAVTSAGYELKSANDLQAGQALSADWTAIGWRNRLDLPDTPVLTPFQAGERLTSLAQAHDFSFFEYWLSDYAGHSQDMDFACALLETFDQVLDGVLNDWDDRHDLLLITSDHGNMEDLSSRRHTTNQVPMLLVGSTSARNAFCTGLQDLTGIAPAILHSLEVML